MSVPKSIHESKGLWRGTSKLNLSELPPDKRVSESNSSLHIDTDEQNSYATVAYDWKYEGKRQEGTILICKSSASPTVQFAWVDSWHQNSAVMHLTGQDTESDSVKAKGTYQAGKEIWGWTIALHFSSDQLILKMENVTPAGEPEWAVEASYKRD